MSNNLIVGVDSGIGSAIFKLLPNSTGTSRRDNEHIFLDVNTKEFPNFDSKFDNVYYCIAINEQSLDTINVNAVLSYECLKHIANYVNDDGTIVVLTSIMGSLTKGTVVSAEQANIYYRMSKASLNIGVMELAKQFNNINWQLVHPGFVKTKLTMNLSYIDQAMDPLIVAEKIIKLPKIKGISYIEIDVTGTRMII